MLRDVTSLVTLRIAACLTAGAVVVLSGCSGSSTDAGTGTSPGTKSSSASPSTSSSATEIVVSVKDSKVSPKAHRVKVKAGSQVRILVSSDIDDEVHVHGYDIEREVSAGQSVSIEFTANQTGVFEVETHESGLLLLQLQVQ